MSPKISALAEMWLFKAMRAQKDAQVLKDAGEIQDERKNSTPNFLTIIFRRLNILTLICFSPAEKSATAP